MKAVVCTEFGPLENLSIREVDSPALFQDSVRIRLTAASVNGPDVLMPQGRYQVKPPVPFIPGVEGTGIVIEAAPGVTEFAPGDRVMTYPGLGCFAEEVVAPSQLVYPVPEGMGDETAAGFVLAYGTSYHALFHRAQLRPGESVVVLGASGGLGLSAIQIAKALGATVIAVASTTEKLERCRQSGADHLVLGDVARLRDRIRGLTAGRGADVIYDPVGGDATEAALRGIARYGRLLIVGYASGVIPLIKGNLVLLKQANVVGVSFRQFAQQQSADAKQALASVCELFKQGRLPPCVSSESGLEDIVPALRLLVDRKVIGKAVIRISKSSEAG